MPASPASSSRRNPTARRRTPVGNPTTTTGRRLPARAAAPQHRGMTTTLITGANKGLGKETARLLIETGHTVWLGARDEARGTAAAAELGARFVRLDVTDDAGVTSALKAIAESGTGLDVLVNNAGIAERTDGASMSEALDGPSVLEVFDTNAVGIVRVTQAALPLLQRSANPVIVNVSSALGSFWATREPSRPASRFVSIVYGASKAAVSMLTVQYARAYPGIKVDAVERWPASAPPARPEPSRRTPANSAGSCGTDPHTRQGFRGAGGEVPPSGAVRSAGGRGPVRAARPGPGSARASATGTAGG